MKDKLPAVVIAATVMGAAGLSLLNTSEGLRLKPYLDPAGIPTVCYGHTGSDIVWGKAYTKQECEFIRDRDIKSHLTGLKRCIKVPLTQNQQDAVLDLAFNIGVERTCGSTLVKKVNKRDFLGASEEFPKWNKARVNGKLVVLPGLDRRRAAERALFLKDLPEK
ncbi:endolysin [Caulobacter phage Lullwater]|uniref:Lysozyme n=1 Tax=Caulobacter phage Lullwater TaxID=2024607 RepID=A0A291LB53_9CAUD|nr:endolysin [Caulobacter phage Lullwater]ATI16357.1 SAR endolysin [Caulobacter phage Lullwater]